MTAAKAQALIDALAAVTDCVDVGGSDAVAFDDARAAVEQWVSP